MKHKHRFLIFYFLTIALVISLAHYGSETVTTIAQSKPVVRSHTIIIDAGHGGEDGGATSCTGVLESAFNLEIALRLDDLMHLIGYDTKMIRTTDISVYTEGTTIAAKKVSDLKQRVKIVNETEGALLVSIHQNTFSDSRYSGAQVFYSKEEGASRLASAMQTLFTSCINPGSHRKSKPAEGVYLMEHIEPQGVLVECGFLSNPEEEAKLRSIDYQQKICCVIASSVSEYFRALDGRTNG